MARRIVGLIPEHVTYVEPFAGGAQVFFQKPRSKLEVLNDVDLDVSNFLKICQRHPAELARVLRWQPASRLLFENHQRQPPELLTDIERAARFYFLQRNAWGGRYKRQSFRFSITHPANNSPDRLPRRLEEVAARLDRVQIEHLSYADILDRYDRSTTFFYCDPPYVGVDLYRHNFSDDQFQHLADRLTRLKGQFLLSINDCQKARSWFRDFNLTEVRLTYTAIKRPRQFQELLFSNYQLRPRSP